MSCRNCIRVYPIQDRSVIGFIKGKRAIAMARLSGKERNTSAENVFGLAGMQYQAVGCELKQVRRYIRAQGETDCLAGGV